MNIKALFRQFISYFFVGGTAALVEWLSFSACFYLLGIGHMVSTVIAFIIATFVNWILGRRFTFKDDAGQTSVIKDLVKVYLASLIGLFLNLGFMYLFVDVLSMHPMLSKILATGLVFIWNFAVRRFVIYKGGKKEAL